MSPFHSCSASCRVTFCQVDSLSSNLPSNNRIQPCWGQIITRSLSRKLEDMPTLCSCRKRFHILVWFCFWNIGIVEWDVLLLNATVMSADVSVTVSTDSRLTGFSKQSPIWCFGLTCYRSMRIWACININKWAGAHGTVDIPGIKTTLSKHRCLLVCYLKEILKKTNTSNYKWR